MKTQEPGLFTEPQQNTKDVWLIIAMRAIRAAAYGMLAVLLAVSLQARGFAPAAIGLLITVSLIGDFVGTYLIGLFADAWGRRRTLFMLACLMATTGVIFAVVDQWPLLMLTAFVGTLGTTASETAPFLPLEQAILAEITPGSMRTTRFAHYNLMASGASAIGAGLAGIPVLLVHQGVPYTLSLRLFFGVYTLFALVVAGCSLLLSPQVERAALSSAPDVAPLSFWRRLVPPLGRQRGLILSLAGLFSVDAFAGGLIVQSLLVLFLHQRFQVDLALLAALFFGANLCSALSFLAAAPLARRIGLLNTMVFTHLPSNLLLILAAFMPTFPLAAVVLLLRQLLSQMDVPTRQAYTMALVEPEQRTATASVTSLARSAGSSSSPALGGLLLQGPGLALGIPLIVAGFLKSVYDLTLWRRFRHVRLPED